MHPEVSEKNTLKIERIDSEVIVILCRVSAYRCLKSINKSSLRPVRSEATKPPLRGGLEGVENSPQQLLQAYLVRRRRDSNPRNVAVQQFSRLPPSTTRPHLHVPSFLNRAAKIGIISKRAKLSAFLNRAAKIGIISKRAKLSVGRAKWLSAKYP